MLRYNAGALLNQHACACLSHVTTSAYAWRLPGLWHSDGYFLGVDYSGVQVEFPGWLGRPFGVTGRPFRAVGRFARVFGVAVKRLDPLGGRQQQHLQRFWRQGRHHPSSTRSNPRRNWAVPVEGAAGVPKRVGGPQRRQGDQEASSVLLAMQSSLGWSGLPPFLGTTPTGDENTPRQKENGTFTHLVNISR